MNSVAMDAMVAAVQAQTDVTQSAITLLDRLSQLITSAGTDQGRLTALTQQLRDSRDTLANAVAMNTPAEGAHETEIDDMDEDTPTA